MSNQFLKLRRSAVPGRIPTTSSLDFGEIALNTYDGLAFMKKSGSSGEQIVTLGTSTSNSGSFTGSFSGSFTGSLLGTASWANNAVTSSYILNAISASFAATASYILNAVSASFAATASSADNFTVRGTLTAQTIVAQTITSSTDFVTGSTRFGSLLSNTHQFTGSVSITGSLDVNGSNVILSNQTSSMSVATASFASTASYALNVATSSLTGSFVTLDTIQTISGSKIFSPSVTAVAGLAVGTNFTPTLSSSANSNTLVGLDITPTFSTGSFTLGSNLAMRVRGNTIMYGGTETYDYPLIVNNTAGTTRFSVRNDGPVSIGSQLYVPSIYGADANGTLNLSSNGPGTVTINGYNNVTVLNFLNSGVNETPTSGIYRTVLMGLSYTPTSGTAQKRYLEISPTINQTGGANGIIRGVYLNPTLTAAADWRSIETTNNTGYALYLSGSAFNYLAGNVGIGVTSSIYKLDVSGSTRINGNTQITGSLSVTQGITGSLFGTSSWANNAITASYVPASGVIGLNLSQISTGSVTASVNTGTNIFNIVSGSNTLVVVDNAGSVGIGVTSPTVKLDINGSISAKMPSYNSVGFQILNADGVGDWYFYNNGNSPTNGRPFIFVPRWASGTPIQIGNQSNSNSGVNEGILIGGGVSNGSVLANKSIRIGKNSNTTIGVGSIVIGTGNASGEYSISISTEQYGIPVGNVVNNASFLIGSGYESGTTANSQGILNATNIFIGRPATTASFTGNTGQGFATSINGMGGYAIADATGGDLTINGGVGLGAGVSGDIIFGTATPTTTGTTLQTLSNRVWIKGQTGNVGIGASPNAAYKLDVSGSFRSTANSEITGSLTVTQGITGSLFGTSSWAQNAVTASYILQAVSASFASTSSLPLRGLITASVAGATITFTKGDSTTFDLTVAQSGTISTASYVTSSGVYGPFGANSILTASYALNGGVTQIIAGTNVTISPTSGTGSVTINATGGGGSAFPFTGSALITGSLVVTGSTTSTLGFTGSLFGTASWANNAVSASFAATASSVNVLNQNVQISGSLSISGSTGSTIFFSNVDTLLLTGSALITGSVIITGSLSVSGSITGSLFGTSSWAQNAITASYISASGVVGLNLSQISLGVITASVNAGSNIFNIISGSNTLVVVDTTGSVGIGTTSPTAKLDVKFPDNNLTAHATFYPLNGTSGVGITYEGVTAMGSGRSLVLSGNGGLGVNLKDNLNYLAQNGALYAYGTSFCAAYSANSEANLYFNYYGYNSGLTQFRNAIFSNGKGTDILKLFGSTGNLVIQNGGTFTDAGYRLDVNGTTRLNGNTQITGSLIVTQGITGSLFGTASWAQNAVTSSYILQAVSSSFATTASYALNGGVTQIVAGTNVTISPTSGTGSVTINAAAGAAFPFTGSALITGSLTVTGSISTTSTLNIGNSQFNNTSSITSAGTTIVSSIATGSFNSAFYNYYIMSASNARAGQIMSVWNGATVRYTEVTTTDIGNTATASFAVVLSGANVQLNFTAPGSWTVKNISNLL